MHAERLNHDAVENRSTARALNPRIMAVMTTTPARPAAPGTDRDAPAGAGVDDDQLRAWANARYVAGDLTGEDREALRTALADRGLHLRFAGIAAPLIAAATQTRNRDRRTWLDTPDALLVADSLRQLLPDDEGAVAELLQQASYVGAIGMQTAAALPDPHRFAAALCANRGRFDLATDLTFAELTSAMGEEGDADASPSIVD
jgi:hypothetical protein